MKSFMLKDYAKDNFPLFALCPINPDYELHNHDFTELVAVFSGHGTHFTEKESCEIRAGDVFVIPKMMSHGYRGASSLSLMNFMFDLETLPVYLEDVRSLPGFQALFNIEPKLRIEHRFHKRLRLEGENLNAIQLLGMKLKSELETRLPGYKSVALALMAEIIAAVSRAFSGADAEPCRQVHALGRVIARMERNYSKRITLDELALTAKMTSRNLLRHFKKATGSSPIDYLEGLRISAAKESLEKTALSITEIAAGSGFSDSNFFSRQFKKTVGVSPREFRRNAKGKTF